MVKTWARADGKAKSDESARDGATAVMLVGSIVHNSLVYGLTSLSGS